MTSEPVALRPGPQSAATCLALPDGASGREEGGPAVLHARRTTTIDTERPEGVLGPARITMRGRDAFIGTQGVDAVAEVVLTADVATDGSVEALTSSDGRSFPDLVGQSLRTGFGALVARTLGAEMEARTLVASMLEDLAGAYFVSGTVLLWAGLNSVGKDAVEMASDMQADVCAGWRRGNQQHVHLLRHAAVAQPDGPPAPPLTHLGGADAWHLHPDLPPLAHRRARLLDVGPTGTGYRVVTHFRDSVRDESPERALHEYGITADVGPDDEVAAVEVVAHVLPWAECPGALASAQQVVGAQVGDLAAFVRHNLRGVHTCTHLNAMLRSLADVVALSSLLEHR